jgi:hypothetical protein
MRSSITPTSYKKTALAAVFLWLTRRGFEPPEEVLHRSRADGSVARERRRLAVQPQAGKRASDNFTYEAMRSSITPTSYKKTALAAVFLWLTRRGFEPPEEVLQRMRKTGGWMSRASWSCRKSLPIPAIPASRLAQARVPHWPGKAAGSQCSILEDGLPSAVVGVMVIPIHFP